MGENPFRRQKGLLYFPVCGSFGPNYLFDWSRADNPLYYYPVMLVSYGTSISYRELLKSRRDQDGVYILVDSGGFQVVQLGAELDPVAVINSQQEAGNCGFILDYPLTGLADRSRIVPREEVVEKAEKTRVNVETAKPYLKEGFEWLGIFHMDDYDVWWDTVIADQLDTFSGIGVGTRNSSEEVGGYGWTLSTLLALSYMREKGYKGWIHLLGVGLPAVMWVSTWWLDYFERITFDSSTPLAAMRYGAVFNSLTGNKVSKVGNFFNNQKTYFCNCEVCSKAEKLGITLDYKALSRILVLHVLHYLVSYADQLNRVKLGGYDESLLLALLPNVKESVFGDLPTIVKASLEYDYYEFRKRLNRLLQRVRDGKDVTSRVELIEKVTREYMELEEPTSNSEKQITLW